MAPSRYISGTPGPPGRGPKLGRARVGAWCYRFTRRRSKRYPATAAWGRWPHATMTLRFSTTLDYHARLARDPRIAGGEATIKGTRVTLRTVLASLAEGATTEEILKAFPTLSREDVRAAIEA